MEFLNYLDGNGELQDIDTLETGVNLLTEKLVRKQRRQQFEIRIEMESMSDHKPLTELRDRIRRQTIIELNLERKLKKSLERKSPSPRPTSPPLPLSSPSPPSSSLPSTSVSNIYDIMGSMGCRFVNTLDIALHSMVDRHMHEMRHEIHALQGATPARLRRSQESSLDLRSQESSLDLSSQEKSLDLRSQEKSLDLRSQESSLDLRSQESSLDLRFQENSLDPSNIDSLSPSSPSLSSSILYHWSIIMCHRG